MNINSNNINYNIENTPPSFSGKEAKVYVLKDKCLKFFFDATLTQESKQKKVLLLCDKHNELANEEGFQYVGVPEHPAYNKDKFIGYTMPFFNNCKTITESFYFLIKQRYRSEILNDSKALSIIKSLFKSLQLLHNHKIILGDINPENILINQTSNKCFIIDIDSADIGNYASLVGMKEYICPTVIQIGKNADDSWSYSVSSDIYSLAIICFELLVGTHPFSVALDPVTDIVNAKKDCISYLHFHQKKHLNYKETELQDKFIYEKVFHRLDELKRNFPEMYHYFINVFVHNKRDYFGNKKTTTVGVKKRKRIQKTFAIRGYTPLHKKSDPKELQIFLKQYNLNLKTIKQ
jgi:serine/threonine protein kinase